jgi:hypothetical protein
LQPSKPLSIADGINASELGQTSITSNSLLGATNLAPNLSSVTYIPGTEAFSSGISANSVITSGLTPSSPLSLSGNTGNTSSGFQTPREAGLTSAADRQIISDVGRGRVKDGEKVTLSNGKSYTVKFDGDGYALNEN